MLQMLFRPVHGHPLAILPRRGDDAPREPDGASRLSIDQAVAAFGMTGDELRDLYEAALGDFVTPEDAAELFADNAPKVRKPSTTAPPIDVLRDIVCGHLNDEQFAEFIALCEPRGLNPLCRQVYARPRWDAELKRQTIDIITKIDGLRAIAARTGKYDGQTAPQWCGEDGAWLDVWTKPTPPAAARVGARRKGVREPFWGIANWDFYAQNIDINGRQELADFWRRGGPHMLAKCAEALALRKANPDLLSGIFSDDEMGQADNPRRRNGVRDHTTDPDHVVHAVSGDDADETPTSRFQFELLLLDRGYKDPAERAEVIKGMYARFPGLAERDEAAFYAKAMRWVRAHPKPSGDAAEFA